MFLVFVLFFFFKHRQHDSVPPDSWEEVSVLLALSGNTNMKKRQIHVRYDTHSLLSPTPVDRICQSQSFNVGTAGAKIFKGSAAEEFGYTVQQSINHQGKW